MASSGCTGNRALLISRYGLDAKPYNMKSEDTTWEQCTLRNWLNSDFLNTAFTAEEQRAILTTVVDNGASQGDTGWKTDGGNDTEDQIFLLSYAGTGQYFNSDVERKCQPTEFAVSHGAIQGSGDNSLWWLRSPGVRQDCVSCVRTGGSLSYSIEVNSLSPVVRPAFWINLESEIF